MKRCSGPKRWVAVLAAFGWALAACGASDGVAPATIAVFTSDPSTNSAPVVETGELTVTTNASAATLTTASTSAATTAEPNTEPTDRPEQANQADQSDQADQVGQSIQLEQLEQPPKALDRAIRNWMERTGAPGVVLAIAHGDDQLRAFAWGLSDLATEAPLTVDHHVRIGSVTKSVTAAVILQLVAEGAVELDAPVARYLSDDWAPGYEYASAVRVRDLLGHTSGFVEYAFDVQFFRLAADRLNVKIAPEEILAFAAKYGPVARLGTEYHYNTTGYVAAGLLIEAVTGETAAEQLRSRVFKPLGLSHVYLTPQEFPPEPTANGYVGGTIGYLLPPLLGLTGDNRITHNGATMVDIGTVPDAFARSAGWTGGGIEARISDVAKLIRGLFATEVLDAAQVALMTTGHPDPDSSYGLGISTGTIDFGPSRTGSDGDGSSGRLEFYSHGGGVPGFRTIAAYVPTLDLGIALNTNVLGLETDDDVDALLESLAPILADMIN